MMIVPCAMRSPQRRQRGDRLMSLTARVFVSMLFLPSVRPLRRLLRESSGGLAMARTERAQYHFTVQEGDGDRFFIAAEPAGDGIEKIRGDLLAFDLQLGAMREEAQLVAEMLNRHIASISLTIVP